MSNPFKDLNAGDDLPTGRPLWNAMIGAAREYAGGVRADGGLAKRRQTGYVEALAFNDTGVDLNEFKPAKVSATAGIDLTDTDFVYDWSRRPVVTLTTPAAATDIIAVTLEAIPDGAFGRVAVAGWCACDVDISSSGHGYASPTTDTDALVSGATGSIRILATGTGTARRTAVYLGDQVASAAATSLSYAESWITSDFSITTGINSWLLSSAPDVTSVIAPAAGNYLVSYTASGRLNTNVVGESLVAGLFLDDGATLAIIPNTTIQWCRVQVANVEQMAMAHMAKVVGLDAGDEVILKCVRYAGGGVITTSVLRGTLVTGDDPDYYPATGLAITQIN